MQQCMNSAILRPLEDQMGVVQVQLSDDLKRIIDRQIEQGHALSEADFLAQAAQLYADHLDTEDEIAAMVERADTDVAARRFATVATPEDSRALHEAAMGRLRARMASDDRR
jgi:Arc/MetJ-type ribon-helix-helix transcriptional regulator